LVILTLALAEHLLAGCHLCSCTWVANSVAIFLSLLLFLNISLFIHNNFFTGNFSRWFILLDETLKYFDVCLMKKKYNWILAVGRKVVFT